MEDAIKILYNGKPFSSIQKVKSPDEAELVTIGMARDVEVALESLRSQIEKEGGLVTVNFKGPAMFEVSASDLSDNLKDKVMRSLRPPR